MLLEKHLILPGCIYASPSVWLGTTLHRKYKIAFKPIPSWNKWKLILKPKDFCLEFDAALSKAGLKTPLLMSVSCSLLGARRIGVRRKIPTSSLDKRAFWGMKEGHRDETYWMMGRMGKVNFDNVGRCWLFRNSEIMLRIGIFIPRLCGNSERFSGGSMISSSIHNIAAV